MTVDSKPAQASPPPWMLWAAWIGYCICWTAALLTTFLVEVRDDVVPERTGFAVGKILHVCAYAGFVVLTSFLPTSRKRRWILLALVSAHGLLTEFVQQYVGRTSSWTDVGLDHVGILIGILITSTRWFGKANGAIDSSH